MKKIFFSLVAAAFIAGSLMVVEVRVARADVIELKLAHFMSSMHVQHLKSFEPFAKRVAELSGGKVTVKIFPGGALGGPTQLPDAVKAGITDIAFIIPSYSPGRFVRISSMDLPFICNSAVQTTKVIYDLYDKYFAPDFNDYKVLWLYSAGPGQFHSTTKPITRLEDLQGAKMRSPSAYMSKALQLIGSNAVGMPISELTVSLQKGVIDGMLTPFSALADFRLYDLVKYITEVDFYVSPMAVVMNKEKFGSLPDFAKKAIMTAAGKEWGLHAAKAYDDHDQDTAKEGSSKYKIKIIKVSDSELKRFKEKVKIMETDWINQTSQKGIPAKEIMDAIYSSAARNK